jgi:hypothetical protein
MAFQINLPRRPHVHLTHLFNHCLRLRHFPVPWKEANIITLPKPGKDPKFPPNLRPISFLSTAGKLFEKLILRIIQKHIEERNLLNTSQFGFRANHSTIFQGMRLADHFTLISTVICRWPLCSWISRKPSTQHSTLAYCINC